MGKFKNKDVYLVMGSNSFSGSNFIDFLLNKNHRVIGVSRSGEIQNDFFIYSKEFITDIENYNQIKFISN